MASKENSNNEDAQSIKALEEEIQDLKKHLQTLGAGPKSKASAQNSKPTAKAASSGTPKKTTRRKKASKNGSASANGNPAGSRQKSYIKQREHNLQQLARDVEQLLNGHHERRSKQWKLLEQDIQQASEARKHYIVQLQSEALQDRIDRLSWLKQLKDSRSKEMGEFFDEFYAQCQQDREGWKKQKAQRQARLKELFER